MQRWRAGGQGSAACLLDRPYDDAPVPPGRNQRPCRRCDRQHAIHLSRPDLDGQRTPTGAGRPAQADRRRPTGAGRPAQADRSVPDQTVWQAGISTHPLKAFVAGEDRRSCRRLVHTPHFHLRRPSPTLSQAAATLCRSGLGAHRCHLCVGSGSTPAALAPALGALSPNGTGSCCAAGVPRRLSAVDRGTGEWARRCEGACASACVRERVSISAAEHRVICRMGRCGLCTPRTSHRLQRFCR
jgi:hypothetical protein